MKLRIILLLSFQLSGLEWISQAFADTAQVTSPSVDSARVPPATQKLDGETRLVLKSIALRYKKLGNWKATFLQQAISVGLGQGTANEGRFEFVAPNKFRYSIMRPDASDFISNGKQAWQVIYRKGRGKPAYVRHFKNVSNTDLDRYLFLLRGVGNFTAAREAELLRDFELKGTTNKGEATLEIRPRHAAEITKITLTFKNDSDAPYRAVLEDALNNKTTITIASWEKLTKPDAKAFEPDYPKGSEVEEL